MCGCVETLGQKGWRKVGLNEEGAKDVVSGTKEALSFTILGRRVGAREAKGDTMGGKEIS
jgi:hypothetical protein